MLLRVATAALFGTLFTAALHPAPAARELVVCGWDEVVVLDVSAETEEPPKKIWSWRARERGDLPLEYKTLFDTTAECKPFDRASKVLITSSGGAVALVDRIEDRVLFYARAANAHSADLLPGGRIAVAASHDRAGKGDRLILFEQEQSERELWSGELPWGHGVIWDRERQRLWALADADIRVYELRDWNSTQPRLHRITTIPLPEAGGHNLSAVPGSSMLAVSTTNRCWLFDRDTKRFRPHPQLDDRAHVKSISYHPADSQIAFVQAEGQNWWAERIHFLNPPRTLHVADEHFYKARWVD